MSKKHFNFKSSIRDWYIRAFPSDQLGYRINPLATFAGAVKCMADGGDIYKYLGVGDSPVRENVFFKIAAITGVDYDAVYDLWLHHDEDDPVTPFERSFREDIFNMPQNRPVGLAVLATLPLDAFLDASLSMIRRGEGENAGTFTVKPGTYEPIFGIYDPVGGCGGTMGTVLDRDFEIDPHDITYTMMEPLKGEWQSDRIDLYTPQDCFGFSDPFGGRIEYSEKPKIAVKAKSEPAELGRRAATAAGASARDGADSRGIKL